MTARQKIVQKATPKGCLSRPKLSYAPDALGRMEAGLTAEEGMNTTTPVVLDPKNSRVSVGKAREAPELSTGFQQGLGREIGAGRG